MKTMYGKKSLMVYMALTVIPLLLAFILGMTVLDGYSRNRKREAGKLLELYKENITLIMQEQLNYAHGLVNMEPDVLRNADWFEWKAQELLSREGVAGITVFNGDTVQVALPEKDFKDDVGKDLRDFSYLYTLAKVVKAPVADGPITLPGTGQSVFLFLQPLLDDQDYRGEIAVALEETYVLSQLHLEMLRGQGYEYHLWKVNSQDGSKDVISSSDMGLDYSYAAKTEFYLPSQWTLSIIPSDGWVSSGTRFLIVGASMILGIILAALLICIYILYHRYAYYRRLGYMDRYTGLVNRNGFCRELDSWMRTDAPGFSIFYFSIDEYSRISLLAGTEEEYKYLRSIQDIIRDYVKNPYIAGRISEGSFAVAVKEVMTEQEKTDFAKGLALKLMWKIRIQGRKLFLSAGYQSASFPEDGSSPDVLLNRLTERYFHKVLEESPLHDLTEKCRLLAEGHTDVEFSEYTDYQMMELSKALNQYRKQAEQAAYFDRVFNIGNRRKFLRDVDMMISYDAKRRFRLYGIDIRSFSKYNELFSVATGDAILMEVIQRLGLIFGSSLYRVNGDVFMGISFEDIYKNHKMDETVSQIRKVFKQPIQVNGFVFTLDILMGICDYPIHAKTADSLLECIQSAINYAKIHQGFEADGIIAYNDTLLKLRQREGRILHLLKNSIRDKSLEVWYQPLFNLKQNAFTAAEALVRLPDGEGGYIDSGEMIRIAEKNGLVSQIGEYTMLHACGLMREQGWELGLEKMGVNLSVQQLLVEDGITRIAKLIKQTGVNPRSITLEITETVLIQSIEKAEGILKKLSEMGLHIALDDFGIGYSSLNYLMNLPVDSLKIDHTMTGRITESFKQFTLLQAIVKMADINHISVVVEGVETREELELIASTNAVYVQGFYYSRPLPPEKFRQFLLDSRT